MDIRKVKKLIEMMEESDITEIEVKEGEESVRISRGITPGVPVAPSVPQPVLPPSPQAPSQQAPAQQPPSPPPAVTGHIITAPMVGTFYRSPSPGSPPFVEVGGMVKEGETICIIESMKMMNQIKSDRSGRVEAVLAENEEAVEFDQPLFTII